MKVAFIVLILMIATMQCAKSTPTDRESTKINGVILTPGRIPMLIGKNDQALFDLKIRNDAVGSGKIYLSSIKINFTPESQTECLSNLSVVVKNLQNTLFGNTQEINNSTIVSGNTLLTEGTNFFTLNFTPKSNAILSQSFDIQTIDLTFSNHKTITVISQSKFSNRPTLILRAAGQDQVNTYRIPGLTTTNKGTLIAVYDIRHNEDGDLQGDIDIGLSRSTDGGQSWSPMKTVLDMGTYNALPQVQNGIGDPSVLVDRTTNTIWVAGLWVSGIAGQKAWNGSKSGMKPGETGQFVLAKSDDDGISWSPPINITEQCKKPEWNLFLQSPGKGITMTDGTLVFPALYKDAQAVPYSTIIHSKDHGKTWTVGTGAKSNTTESQVIELSDGSLMLNMRDDCNRTEKGDKNGRAVSISKDLGQTWTAHSTSNSALPESNCMASLISAKVMVNGVSKNVLFFSNPNEKVTRAHMTIKASLDQGTTWPVEYHVELNSDDSYGYSCLTMVNESTLGILFEGTKDLYFQEIKVSEILK